MVVYDQFETEPSIIYSGSYTDNVMLGDFFSTYNWSDRRAEITPATTARAQRFVFASHVNKFKNVGPTGNSWADDPAPDLPPSGATVLLANGAIVDDMEIFHLIFDERFLSRTKANSPVKFSTSEEIFADSVMPYPPDIVLANGGQFVEGAYQYEKGVGGLYPKDPMSRTPRRFELCLGSPGANPKGGQNYATMTSSTDSSQVSDDIWCISYPFQGRYRNITRFFTPSYAKKYQITLTQSIQGLAADSSEVSTSINNDPFESEMWTINWACEQRVKKTGTDDEQNTHIGVFLGVSGTIVQAWQNTPIVGHFVNVNLPIMSGWDAVGGVVQQPNKYPEINSLYRNFFGFYDVTSQPNLAGNTACSGDGAGFYNNVGKFPYNSTYAYFYPKDCGLTSFLLTGSPVEERDIFWFSAKTGKTISTGISPEEDLASTGWVGYMRINGYKYGCYWPTPIGTYCYFRRGKFGQMRDMMEQRPNTKFYSAETKTALEAAMVATFTSGTQTWLTSSSPDLNTRDSGVYDFEGKSGQPFADRDNED